MFKIECNGPFREGRAMALLSSMVNQNIQNLDIAIIASDGVSIPANRTILAWQSKYLAQAMDSVPCCNTSSISLPFTSIVVKNLLAVMSCGISLPLSRDDLLNVKVAADELDIKLGQLEVEKSEVKPAKKLSKKKQKDVSPQPYHQNDHSGDEIVEIIPEIFAGNDEEDDGGYAPHFLMQAEYGEDDSSAVSSPMSGIGSMANEPELIEIEPEAGGDGEKKFKCSFCPNKIFKKKPEIMRHFKKHIPLSQRKRFQCEMCKEKFISNSNLKTHLKVCNGQPKIYTCKRCKTEFDNKTDYEDHMAEAHNVGRNHECHICHKQLRRAGDVKKHMLTHSEGKPYVCDICGKRFRTESYVKVHKEAHYKSGSTPTKKDRVEEEQEPISEQDTNRMEDDDVYEDNEEYDQEAVNVNEIAVDEEDDAVTENEVDSPQDNTGVMDESMSKFSMTQDNFNEDGTVARVI